jgi:hypothetical protein
MFKYEDEAFRNISLTLAVFCFSKIVPHTDRCIGNKNLYVIFLQCLLVNVSLFGGCLVSYISEAIQYPPASYRVMLLDFTQELVSNQFH